MERYVMKNQIQDGEVLTVTAPYDLKSGEGCLVGSIFGVASIDALAGQPVQIKRRGVFNLVKTSAQAWTAGGKVYWDDTNRRCTTAATGNTLIGANTVGAADPSDTGAVLLDGAVR
jgi:predicted RecA/RadA family phage recombinase